MCPFNRIAKRCEYVLDDGSKGSVCSSIHRAGVAVVDEGASTVPSTLIWYLFQAKLVFWMWTHLKYPHMVLVQSLTRMQIRFSSETRTIFHHEFHATTASTVAAPRLNKSHGQTKPAFSFAIAFAISSAILLKKSIILTKSYRIV